MTASTTISAASARLRRRPLGLGARHHQSSGALPTGFRLALQRICGTIVRAGGMMLADLVGRFLGRILAALAGLALACSTRGCRRSAAARRLVQCLRRPAGGGACRSRPDRRAVAQCARSRDLSGDREGSELSAARTGQAEAMVPLKPDLVLVGHLGPAADAADAAQPRIPRRQRRRGERPRNRDRADPRGRGTARPSRARRGADRGDRSGAPPAGRGAAAEVIERDAGRQQRLHRRPRKPRRRADGRSRAGAAGGRARQVTAATCRSKS